MDLLTLAEALAGLGAVAGAYWAGRLSVRPVPAPVAAPEPPPPPVGVWAEAETGPKNPGLPPPHVHRWARRPYLRDPASGLQLHACVDPACSGVLRAPLGDGRA